MTRAMSAMGFPLAVALLALPACTLLNHPAALPAPPSDAGADAEGLDAGDAGDGGNFDGGPVCRAREVCFNGPSVDDDCDEAIDCADLDCANLAACCDTGGSAPLFTEDWRSATFGVGWRFAPPDTSDTFTVTMMGGSLRGFGSDDRVHSIMPADSTERCVPLALGARIEVILDATACTGSCNDEAAVLLTDADAPASGVSLAADLRVGVGRDGVVTVTSGGTALLAPPGTIHPGGRIVVEISPSARDDIAVLSARVLTGPTDAETVLVADGAFIAQSLLRACAGGPGLAIAIEGRGSGVTVGPLTVKPLACTNPRVFSAGGDAITGADVGATDGWTSGGIAAPALLHESGIVHLFYDATNVDRELESIAPVDFSIGAVDASSFTSTWAAAPRSVDGMAGHPYIGAMPPTCVMPPCASVRSVREPTAVGTYMGDSLHPDVPTHVLAFARESMSEPDVFSIEYVSAPTLDSMPAPAPDDSTVILGAPWGDCVSLRDPSLAQEGETSAGGLWLFYTCERARLPSTIRAVTLERSMTTGLLQPVTDTDVEVVGPTIGAYAEGGVESPAALMRMHEVGLDFPDRTLAARLWFVARGRDGRRTLALAEGQRVLTPAADASHAVAPELSAYAANPLLRGDASELGACDGMCDVRDVGIGRLPSSTALTVLVARRVDRTAGGTEWQLVPLVQTLEARWWGLP